MKINRILAAVVALLITANNMSFVSSSAAVAEPDDDAQLHEEISEKIKVLVDDDVIADIIPKSKEYDGKDLEVFEMPVGQDNDDVSLKVSVRYNSSDVADTPALVTVRNIYLDGPDKDKYELINEADTDIRRTITVEPRTLQVSVNNPELMLGSSAIDSFVPDNVSISVADGPDGQAVRNLGAKLKLNGFKKEVGVYDDFSLTWNDDIKNYRLALKENSAVTVKHPAVSNISAGFSAAATANSYGIIGNNVKITVSVDTFQKSDTDFSINFAGKNYSVSKKAGDCSANGSKFTYSADFILNCKEGEAKKGGITASVKNDFVDISNKPLVFTYNNGREYASTGNVIIDNAYATAEGELNYYNKERYFLVDLNVVDADSGIKKIEYCVDKDKTWHTYGLNKGHQDNADNKKYFENNSSDPFSFSDAPGATVKFLLKVPYDSSYWVTNNDHVVYLKIYDNANVCYNTNTRDINVSIPTGYDQQGPELVSAEIISSADQSRIDDYRNLLADGDENAVMPEVSGLSKIANIRSYGTYFKEPFVINIGAKDKSDTQYFNGPGTISITSNNTVIKSKDKFSTENSNDLFEGSFTFTEADARPIGIHLEDKCGLTTTINAWDAFGFSKAEMPSDNFVFEETPPVISIDFSEKVSDYGKSIWYGPKGGKVKINIADKGNIVSGLSNVTVKVDGVELNTDEYNAIDFSKKQINSQDIIIDTLKLSSGDHMITVEAVDNCGNPVKSDPKLIRVDHSKLTPKLATDISPKIIEGKNWFTDNDSMVLTASVVSPYSVVTSIDIYCNGKKLNSENVSISFDEKTNTYTGKLSKKDQLAAEKVKDLCDDKSQFDLYAVVKTNTLNTGSSPVTEYHVDMGTPFIKNINVERKEGAMAKFFPKLGIFANEDLVFKVKAADRKYDTGIDHLEVIFIRDGKTITDTMDYDEANDRFLYAFPLDDDVFRSRILIRAVDKFGRFGSDFPLEDTDEVDRTINNDVFTMIEDVPPVNSIDLPDGDGKTRSDGQVWYRTDKEITVTASDADSGICLMNVTVNGKPVETDKNGAVIPGVDFISSQDKLCTDELSFVFDSDTLAELAGENEDGKFTVRVETFDLAGNPSVAAEKTFFIDKLPPAVSEFSFDPITQDDIDKTDTFVDILEYGFYFKSAFNVRVKADDAAPSSGYDEIEYRLIPYDNGEAGEITVGTVKLDKNGEAVIKIPSGFKGQITAKASDMTGNVSEEKMPDAFVADEIAPEITIEDPGDSSHHDAEGNALFTEDKSVRITISDFKSGLRSFGYSVSAEKNPSEDSFTDINNTGHQVGEIINGWEITSMDNNLVTSVTRVIDFTSDDNDIAVNAIAFDRSNNSTDWKTGQRFSIDKTAPVVNVSMSGGVDDSNYYSENQKAVIDIIVKERNFSSELFNTEIANSFTGSIPSVSFAPTGNPEEYHASITFPEGDFTFRLSGQDLAGHQADISSGGDASSSYYANFFVDYTKPVAAADLNVFGKEGDGNYFNSKKSTKITVKEHNFRPELMNLRIRRKQSGSAHDLSDMSDSYYSYYSKDGWQVDPVDPDTHFIDLVFPDDGSADGVYVVDIMPSDISGNVSDLMQSAVFEMDCTAPVISGRNGVSVAPDDYDFLDVYGFDRKDEEIPFVDFSDINFDHLKYEYVRYAPVFSNGKEIGRIEPAVEKKSQNSSRFTLPDFDKDGVYAVKLTAVDKAGNESVVSENTYMRMVDTDVLAYIEESDPADKTGWYSIEDSNGPISKRPDSFKDLSIVVLSKNNADNHIVLLDENEKETDTGITPDDKQDMFGVGMFRFTLPSSYFTENYTEDADTMLYLRVNSNDQHIDLGRIHIDNIAPKCAVPEHFKDWGWFAGSGEKTIRFSNITEILDPDNCIAYVTHKGVTEEVKMTYDPSDNSASLTLGPGKYSVGVSLADRAGNTFNIPEISHLAIGNYRIWLAAASAAGLAALIAAVLFIMNMIKRKRLR